MIPKTAMKRLVIFLSFFASVLCFGQIDFPVHFTDVSLRINPANLGIGENYAEGARGGAFVSYKNQTSDMFGASSLRIIDAGIEQSFVNRSVSIGVNIFSGTLCKTALKDVSANFSLAYHWTISKDILGNIAHRLSFGLQAGYRNFAVNTDILTTTGMYDPKYAGGVDWSKSPLSENYNATRHIFDMAGGIYYMGAITSLVSAHVGVSVNHLTRPKTAFIAENTRTPIRTVVQMDVTWQSAEYNIAYNNKNRQILTAPEGMISISGDVLYSNQGKFHAIEAGTRFRYHFNAHYAAGILLHGRYENNNGEIIPGVSCSLAGLTIRAGYEIFFKHSATNMLSISLRYSW
jgi:hypothetical protein